MEVKPGYKQTEIGMIPDDWEIKTLGDLSRMLTGRTPPTNDKSNYGHDFLFVGPGDLGQAKYIEQSEKMLSCKGFSKAVQIPTDSIMITCIGSTIGKVGVAAKPLATNQQINSIVPSTSYDSDFLYYILLLNVPLIRSMASEQAVPIINKTNISSFKIPCPPLPEQKRICEPINDIDSLITSIEKLIEKKKLIMQGVMQELLTGKRRLPGFRREWETKRLGDVSVVIMGQSPDSKYYNADSKGIPLIQGNADIQNGKSVSRIWTKSITKECQKGAILITVRAPVGSVGISSSRACLGRGVCAVQPYSVNERYLYWQLKFSEDKWNESQQGSTFTSVNSNQIKDFCILCPTSFDEQAAIADVIEDIEIEIDLHIKQLNKQILLKQATMQELLTGRIRLI